MPDNFKKKKHRKHKKQTCQQTASDKSGDNDECVSNECCKKAVTEENNNKPYLVQRSNIYGRYLVASRNLKAGEKIIEVEPLVVGPWAESDPVCLGCHRPFEKSSKIVRCSDCDWPICSASCTGVAPCKAHKTLECIPLKEHNVSKLLVISSVMQIKQMYEAIFVLRCLLLKKTDPEKYAMLMEMESLNELRRNKTSLWKRNQEVIVERIRDDWKFDEYSDTEIHTVCGIIEVNSFQIGQNEVHARALYPEAFYIMHDCTPNTTHTDDLVSHVLSVRVTNDLNVGDAITLSYSFTLQGTLKRRQHLYDCKFFWCQCKRCSDPTEFGTNCSTLKCTKCSKGYVIPANPLDQVAEWKCLTCSHTMSAQVVTQLLDKLFKELDAIGGNSIDIYEKFIKKYQSILHENHYLFLAAKHSLCQLYGKISGYLISEMNIDQIKQKEALCRDLLTVVDKYEPGYSRLRGVIMYELHAPLMVQAKYQFETRQINANQLKRRLLEVSQLLKQSAKILSFEPVGSPEYEMALAARDAVQKLQG